MTTVGHTLTGMTIAVLTLPPGRRWVWYLWAGHWYLAFANLPDFPLPFWGHRRYDVSHSLFVTLALATVLVTALYARRSLWRELGPAVVFAYVAAWLSHLLLDSFYNHGHGIGIFWPFSKAHLTLPIPIFSTARIDDFWSIHNARVFAIELVVYGGVLGLAVLIRRVRA